MTIMLKPEDIKTEYYPPQPTSGMLTGGYAKGIKITHIKSGISAICEIHRNQHKNRQGAMDLLEQKLGEATL